MPPRSTLYSITFDIAEIHFYHLVGMAVFRDLPFSDIEFDTTRTYIRQSVPADRFGVWDRLLTEIKSRSSISSKASRLPPRPFFPPRCEVLQVQQACQALAEHPSRYSFDMELKELYLTVVPELHLPTENPVAGLRIASMVDEDGGESNEEEDESDDEGSESEPEDDEGGEDDDIGPPVRLNAHFRQYAAHRPPLGQILGIQKARPGKEQARPGRARVSSTRTRTPATQEHREPGRDEDARAGTSTQAIAVREAEEGQPRTGGRSFPATQPAAVRTSMDAGGTGDITPHLLNTGERFTPPFAPVRPSGPCSEGPMDVDVSSARARALERQRHLPGQTDSSLLAPIEEIIRRLESCPVLNYFDLWSRRPVRSRQTELLEWLCRCCKTGYQTKIGPDKKLVTASLVTHLYHCRNRMAPDAAGLQPWNKIRKERVRKGKRQNDQDRIGRVEGGDAEGTARPPGPSTSRRADERRHLRRAYLCWMIRHGTLLTPTKDEEAGPLMGLLDEEAAPPDIKELDGLRDDLLSDVQASVGQSPGRFTLVYGINTDVRTRQMWLCVHATWMDSDLRPRNACIMVQPIEWTQERLAQNIARTILDQLGRLGLTGKWSGFVVAAPTRINAHVFHHLGLERLKAARGLTDDEIWGIRRWDKKNLRFVPCILSMIEGVLAAHGFESLLRARDACGEGDVLPTATEAANRSEENAPSQNGVPRNRELNEMDAVLWLLEREKSIQLPFTSDGIDGPPRGTISLAALQDALRLSLGVPSGLARSILETMDAIIADAREGSTVAGDWSVLTDVLAATVRASSSDGEGELDECGAAASLIEAVTSLSDINNANPVVAAASFLRTDVSIAPQDLEAACSCFKLLHDQLSCQLDIMTPDTGPGLSASERILLQLRSNTQLEAAEVERASPARRRRADSDGRGASAFQRRRMQGSTEDEIRRYGREGLTWRRGSTNSTPASMPSLALKVWAFRRAEYPSLAQSAATLLAVPVSADMIDRTRTELGRMGYSHRGLGAQAVGVATVTKMLLLAGFSTKRD
ncbi:hypothetical protein OC844_005306 [Tilletia horrida]|nr:hypothetical protein OC844_005306 [Tilletia horrida]